MHVVAVGQRLSQWLEHHDAYAAAERRPSCVSVERAAPAIGRKHAARLVQVTGSVRDPDRDAAGQRHVALAIKQALAGEVDRDQRR